MSCGCKVINNLIGFTSVSQPPACQKEKNIVKGIPDVTPGLVDRADHRSSRVCNFLQCLNNG